MGKVAGILVGVLLVGGAVVALGSVAGETSTSDVPIPGCTDATAQNFSPTATVDNGSCIYEQGESPKEKEDEAEKEQQDKEEEQRRKAYKEEWDADCAGLYRLGTVRQGNDWHQVLDIGETISDMNCDVNRVYAMVYINKTKFIQGEDIEILIFKKYYTEEDEEWIRWGASSKVYGYEPLSFKIGVEQDSGEIILREFSTYLNSTANINRGTIPNIPDNIKDLWDDWGVQRLTLKTNNLIIGEQTNFKIKARVAREWVDRTWPVGNCSTVSDSKTVESVFSIYPNKCKTFPSINNAESFETEWGKSHHSFMSEWW